MIKRLMVAVATLFLLAGAAQAATPSCATIRKNVTVMLDLSTDTADQFQIVSDAAELGDRAGAMDACVDMLPIARRYIAQGKRLGWTDLTTIGQNFTSMASACRRNDLETASVYTKRATAAFERTTAVVQRCNK